MALNRDTTDKEPQTSFFTQFGACNFVGVTQMWICITGTTLASLKLSARKRLSQKHFDNRSWSPAKILWVEVEGGNLDFGAKQGHTDKQQQTSLFSCPFSAQFGACNFVGVTQMWITTLTSLKLSAIQRPSQKHSYNRSCSPAKTLWVEGEGRSLDSEQGHNYWKVSANVPFLRNQFNNIGLR